MRRPLRFLALTLLSAMASLQLWCATDDQGSVPLVDATPPDAGFVDTAPAPDGAEAAPPLTCTAAFCRVTVPGAEAVALNGIFARGANDVWLVGSSGFAAHFDGTDWQRIVTKTNQSLFAAWGASGGPLWATSAGSSFFQLDRSGPDGGVARVDGGWTSIVTALSGAGANDAYAVGSVWKADPFDGDPATGDSIWHYTGPDAGAGWRPVSPSCLYFGVEGCVKLHAIWVQNAQTAWFAGESGKIYRTDPAADGGAGDGGATKRLRLVETSSSSLRTLNGLWGAAADDIWAVGAQGAVRHWSGGDAWTIAASPTTEDLYAVWGAGANDVWAVGDHGVVIHWDGHAWTLVATPFVESNRARLYSVSGTGSDVWIAGESTLLRAVTGGAP